MKRESWFGLTFIFIVVSFVSAQQTRTITNDDLEKYRQKRVAAERDLRENYERLGFPSPAELEKQIEQSRVERSELAERLRAESLETERLDLERQRVERQARSFGYQNQTQNQNYATRSDDYFYNYPSNGFFSFPNNRFNRFNRGGFGNRNRRSFDSQPRIEYRNNLPVTVQPPPRPIFAPRTTGGGRRN